MAKNEAFFVAATVRAKSEHLTNKREPNDYLCKNLRASFQIIVHIFIFHLRTNLEKRFSGEKMLEQLDDDEPLVTLEAAFEVLTNSEQLVKVLLLDVGRIERRKEILHHVGELSGAKLAGLLVEQVDHARVDGEAADALLDDVDVIAEKLERQPRIVENGEKLVAAKAATRRRWHPRA